MCHKEYRSRSLGNEESHLFEYADSAFALPVGAKIAMAIVNKVKPTPRSAGVPGLSPADVEGLFGAIDQVVINTGEVLSVSANYFCQSINTYASCAGAIVFLLDQHQPVSIPSLEYGKAVGVHAAGHPNSSVHRSVGFQL
jgi:hypothetical protein